MKISILKTMAGLDIFDYNIIRYGTVLILVWIGALKFATYEADGITPFVANSPLMSSFYNHPSEYKKHVNKEGELVSKNHQWHIANNTYGFSKGLGILLMGMGILVGLHKVAPLLSVIGSVLVFIMALGTLSFLATTPETWVPALGDQHNGFPYLSGRGRIVIKDLLLLGGSFLTMSESARFYLSKNNIQF
ncbi:YkgB family protein [Parapedobacter tibetensis]|uniref:YkgB family protein n=1 Tax=Parapedobacter tibetensis TaxID=2972951 RepID=UPI00214D9760|nr:YkgB family protein [Parapedobacter tibetensis]